MEFFVEQKDGTSIITEGTSIHAAGYRKWKNGGTYGVKSKAAVFEFIKTEILDCRVKFGLVKQSGSFVLPPLSSSLISPKAFIYLLYRHLEEIIQLCRRDLTLEAE